MKRARWTFLVAAALAMVLTGFVGRPPSAAASATPACLPDNRLPVTVLARGRAGQPFAGVMGDGNDPYVDPRSNRTMVPMRSLFEALSPGTDSVKWNAATGTASFWWNGHTLNIHIPSGADRTYTGTLDGKSVGVTAFLCNGRIWAQARSVAEAFQMEIEYYDPGVVVIDPLGGLPAQQQLKTTAYTASAARSCGPAPNSFLGFLASPISTTRQAGNYVACRILTY